MEPFVTMGLVLKETRYREADRILTILTPKLGVITACLLYTSDAADD